MDSAVGRGRFSAARATCSPEAFWELAEIEERWGDALFFAGEQAPTRISGRRTRRSSRPGRGPAVPPEKPSRSERLAAVRESQERTATHQTEFARLFQDAGHWVDRELGDKWREAGQALATYPEGARRAYAWSLSYFERYNRSRGPRIFRLRAGTRMAARK